MVTISINQVLKDWNILRDYAQYSMEHFGTDERGILQARKFFCEFISFFHRYIQAVF